MIAKVANKYPDIAFSQEILVPPSSCFVYTWRQNVVARLGDTWFFFPEFCFRLPLSGKLIFVLNVVAFYIMLLFANAFVIVLFGLCLYVMGTVFCIPWHKW